MNDHEEYANGLRAMADWIEKATNVPLPPNIISNYNTDSKEHAEAIIRAGGPCRKEYSGDIFYLRKSFGPITLENIFYRKSVCTPRVVGVETIPAKFVEAHTIPARTVDVLEWDCSPILAASEDEVSPETRDEQS